MAFPKSASNPTPSPTPTPPPTPTPVPPLPPGPVITGWSGTITYVEVPRSATVTQLVPSRTGPHAIGKKFAVSPNGRADAARVAAALPTGLGINWSGILAEIELLIQEYGPLAMQYIEQYLASLNLPAWAVAVVEALIALLGAAEPAK